MPRGSRKGRGDGYLSRTQNPAARIGPRTESDGRPYVGNLNDDGTPDPDVAGVNYLCLGVGGAAHRQVKWKARRTASGGMYTQANRGRPHPVDNTGGDEHQGVRLDCPRCTNLVVLTLSTVSDDLDTAQAAEGRRVIEIVVS